MSNVRADRNTTQRSLNADEPLDAEAEQFLRGVRGVLMPAAARAVELLPTLDFPQVANLVPELSRLHKQLVTPEAETSQRARWADARPPTGPRRWPPRPGRRPRRCPDRSRTSRRSPARPSMRSRRSAKIIGEVNEVATAIAAAAQQQGAATQEIARSTQYAAQGTKNVSDDMSGVKTDADCATATNVKLASEMLEIQRQNLGGQVTEFLRKIGTARSPAAARSCSLYSEATAGAPE